MPNGLDDGEERGPRVNLMLLGPSQKHVRSVLVLRTGPIGPGLDRAAFPLAEHSPGSPDGRSSFAARPCAALRRLDDADDADDARDALTLVELQPARPKAGD